MIGDESYESKAYDAFSYLARGRYAEQLERWLEHFDQSRVLILLTEEVFGRPAETWTQLTEFLGLPLDQCPPLPSKNVGSYQDRIAEDTRDWLEEHFAPHNRRLGALLGREPGW